MGYKILRQPDHMSYYRAGVYLRTDGGMNVEYDKARSHSLECTITVGSM